MLSTLTNSQLRDLITDETDPERGKTLDKLVKIGIAPAIIKLAVMKSESLEKYTTERSNLLNTVAEYLNKEVDQVFWKSIEMLCSLIFANPVDIRPIQQLMIQYQEQGNTTMQVAYILGAVIVSDDWHYIIQQTVNIMPFLIDETITVPLYLPLIYHPFVKHICTTAITQEYVGSRQELVEIMNELNSIEANNPNGLKMMFSFAVRELSIEIPAERKIWLIDLL